MYTPIKPHFYYIKVGCKGVFITRTCYHDGTEVEHSNTVENMMVMDET